MPRPVVSHRPHSFLLRCWQERSADDADDADDAGDAEIMLWRFSLREVVETPQEHGFNSAEQLIEFLLLRLKEKELPK